MSENQARNPQRPGRLQAPPPALLSAGEPFEGFSILGEWTGREAVVLWQLLRDAQLWAGAPESPGRLFDAGTYHATVAELSRSDLEDALKTPLLVLAAVLTEESHVSQEELASACRTISAWSSANERPQTSIAFAQAAAIVHPADPDHAYATGLLCRRNAEYNRAETWFRRSLTLARRSKNFQTLGLSWIGLGNLFIQRGNYDAARIALAKALRIARRRGYWRVKAMALHDLFAIAVELRQVEEAERLARQAFRAYSPADPQLPALAHDVAGFWMQQGHYERALLVYTAVLRLIKRPTERLVALSTFARAAAGAGDLKKFTDAWIEVWKVVDQNPNADCACAALLNLAYGAAILRDWERVDLTAKEALERACKRGEAEVQVQAEALLRAVREQTVSVSLLQPATEPKVVERADALARAMARRLTARAGKGKG